MTLQKIRDNALIFCYNYYWNMLPLFAIPIVQETTPTLAPSFFSLPADEIIFSIFVWFGWIPIVITLFWGFIQMWKNYRQGIFSRSLKYVLLAIDVPAMTEQTPKALENLFASIYGCKSSLTWKEIWIYGRLHPVFSFEIISSEGYIQFLIRTQTRFRDSIEAGIYAHYPDAEITEVDDYTEKFPSEFPDDEYEMWGGELTLDKHYMYPIRTYIDFEDRLTQEIKDPLGYTLEQMARMKPGEHFWIQILVQPSTGSWKDEGVAYVNKIYGKEEKKKKSMVGKATEAALTLPAELVEHATEVNLKPMLFSEGENGEDDPWKVFKISLTEKEEADAILRKATKVGHGAKIRILYTAKKNAFVKVERTGMVKGILLQYSHLNWNKFTLYIPQVPKDDYFWMRWVYTKKQEALMRGYKTRNWGIGADPIFLNTEELASLWHFPTIAIKAPLVKKAEARKAEPPVGLPITLDENTLPGLGVDTQPLADIPVEPASPVAKAEPPIGLPREVEALRGLPSELGEPLSEALPSVEAPSDEIKKDDSVPSNLPI